MATMERTLERARIALNNALNEPQVLATLSLYGYNGERLQLGMALYTIARDLAQTQSDARHSKVSATKGFYQNLRQAKLHYHHDLRAARLALQQNEESRYFLQLKGRRMGKFDGWHEQAKDFYFGLRVMDTFRRVAQAAFASAPAYLATLGLTPEPRKKKEEVKPTVS